MPEPALELVEHALVGEVDLVLDQGLGGDGDRRRLAHRSQEMDETARMMSRNEEREFIERKQLDIYRRLLDARRSRREKDETEERKSWTAKENISIGADQLASDLGEKEQDLNKRMKEAMNDDFDPEYIRLIRRYFESLLQKN